MENFFRNRLTIGKLGINGYKVQILLITISLLLFQTGFSQQKIAGKTNNKPNVLLILIDDLGWKDIGPYGSTFYDTPNIDELAKQSIKFTNAYAACPVCSPSRAAIMTGKYPAQLQLTDWLGAKQPEDELKETRPGKIKPLLPAPYITYLPLEEFTVAEAFKKDGYKTFIAGKWHLSDKNKSIPTEQGFDQYYEGTASHPSKGVFELTKEVNSFITDHQRDPFFVYFATYSVHIPLLAAEENIDKYKKKRAASGITEEFETTPSGKTRIVQGNPVYAATVYEMDQAVGSVLDKLKELGLEDNTIVVFASDNGGVATAQGWPTSNSPLRGGKGWMYEGGIRIPLMVRWPGVSKPGATNDCTCNGNRYIPDTFRSNKSTAN